MVSCRTTFDGSHGNMKSYYFWLLWFRLTIWYCWRWSVRGCWFVSLPLDWRLMEFQDLYCMRNLWPCLDDNHNFLHLLRYFHLSLRRIQATCIVPSEQLGELVELATSAESTIVHIIDVLVRSCICILMVLDNDTCFGIFSRRYSILHMEYHRWIMYDRISKQHLAWLPVVTIGILYFYQPSIFGVYFDSDDPSSSTSISLRRAWGEWSIIVWSAIHLRCCLVYGLWPIIVWSAIRLRCCLVYGSVAIMILSSVTHCMIRDSTSA